MPEASARPGPAAAVQEPGGGVEWGARSALQGRAVPCAPRLAGVLHSAARVLSHSQERGNGDHKDSQECLQQGGEQQHPCRDCGGAGTHQGRDLHLLRPVEASGGRRKVPWEASTPSLLMRSPMRSPSPNWELSATARPPGR